MSNLAKLEFAALDVSGHNYIRWAVSVKLHLKGKGLIDTIDKSKKASEESKANAMIFLLHHIHDDLKDEYISKEDPADLWQSLKDRFDHQRYVILPKAKHEWLNLRFQDYKSVSEYNSALFGITSRIMLCGEKITDYDMIEKTLQTFHPGNVILQQQYRANEYQKYSDLMQVLLVAEQNNELVMINHRSRPTGSTSFPEANVASTSYNNRRGRGQNNNRGRGRGLYGRGRGRGQIRKAQFRPDNNERNYQKSKGKEVEYKQHENRCYRCGLKGHWSRTCRTPKLFVKLYQDSQKSKEKQKETNFLYSAGTSFDNEAGPSFDNEIGLSKETEDENLSNGIDVENFLDVADFAVDSVDISENQN